MTDVWELFPYPTLANGHISDGSTMRAHPDCIACPSRPCTSDNTTPFGEAQICRFGLTYSRVDDSRRIVGVLARGMQNPSARATRRFRQEPDRVARLDSIMKSVETARRLGPGVVDDFEISRDELLNRLQTDPAMHRAMAEQLRKDFDENLEQSHDFLQLVKQVRGYAEVLLRAKHPEIDPYTAATLERSEGAIFFATSLMTTKLDSLVFLNEVNRAFGEQRRFEIHPLVLKYKRIYGWQADQKNLRIGLTGECHAVSYYNDQAIGAVVQGLLDNMVKYAPASSDASVDMNETDDSVSLAFKSLGPKIEVNERARIFLPKFRAKAARELESSGLGVGLATVKQLSDALDLGVYVEQNDTEDPDHPTFYRTTFGVALKKVGTASRR